MVLELDKYEADNLAWALREIMRRERLNVLNTGDWVGQILWKLWPDGDVPEGHAPNGTQGDLGPISRGYAYKWRDDPHA